MRFSVHSHKARIATVLLLAVAASCLSDAANAQDFLDALDDKLSYASVDGTVQAKLSLIGDVTLYSIDTPAPGLLFTNSDFFAAPRLSAFLDVQLGERVSLHAQMRADRGFDPGLESGGQVRMDEYFVDYHAMNTPRLDLRAGKFATVFGSWADRSLAWDNPMITAPNAYDTLVPITASAAPSSAAAFAARRNVPANKSTWVPVIWGASYATGAAVLGQIDAVDYALEVKNVAPSANPDTWDGFDYGFPTRPTATARLGYRPAPEWTLGTSLSRGPYLREVAQSTLPAGTDLNDFDQTIWGVDAAFAHGSWQVWSELIHSTFDVPRVGNVAVLVGYVETKYKITAQTWAALRLNHSWYGDNPALSTSWDRNATGVDAGLGYRINMRIEAKLQYSYNHQQSPDNEGHHLVAAQMVMKF